MAYTPFRGAARRLALAAALSAAAAVAVTPALARSPYAVDRVITLTPDEDVPDAPDVALPDTQGALVFHGNYCGPGSKGPGLPPTDALDAACMHHDACSPPAGQDLPSCACNARLHSEASAVARSPRTPADERVAAQFVAEGSRVLACR